MRGLDTLITVENRQVHCVYGDEPVNYTVDGKFAQTQDLVPVRPFVYSVMMWRTDRFREAMAENGFAFFVGKVGFYPVSRLTGIIIKTADDLRLADRIKRAMQEEGGDVEYDPLAEEV